MYRMISTIELHHAANLTRSPYGLSLLAKSQAMKPCSYFYLSLCFSCFLAIAKSLSPAEELRDKVVQWVEGTQAQKAAIKMEYGEIGQWDVSQVTDMSGASKNLPTFHQNIASWDTSRVEDMLSMFLGAAAFNQPLRDTSQVIKMGGMSSGATAFPSTYGTHRKSPLCKPCSLAPQPSTSPSAPRW